MKNKLILPPQNILIDTTHGDDDDPLRFYYLFPFRYIYRKRLRMALSVAKKKYNRLLEIGYGSGIFFPSLARLSKQIYGLDIHKKNKEIMKQFKQKGINVNLKCGDLRNPPFPGSFFDVIFCISTLEHLESTAIKRVFGEFNRLLSPQGEVIIGVPARNILTDIFFEKFCKVTDHAGQMHKSSPQEILSSMTEFFNIEEILSFPLNLPPPLSFYIVIKASKRIWSEPRTKGTSSSFDIA